MTDDACRSGHAPAQNTGGKDPLASGNRAEAIQTSSVAVKRQCATLVSVAVALKSYQQPFDVIEPGARTQGSQALGIVGFFFTSGVGTKRSWRCCHRKSAMRG
jgi:hypothetical protein